MRNQNTQPQRNAPPFSTLLWDGMKTGATTGAAATAIIPACATSIPGFFLDLMFGDPDKLPISKALMCLVGGAAAIPGAVIGLLAAVPLAVSAKSTRKFKLTADITPLLDKLAGISTADRKGIINAVLEADNASSVGIRSYESHKLRHALKDEGDDAAPWEALCNYMDAKTETGIYVNNGKKLFNIVLAEAKKVIPAAVNNIANNNNLLLLDLKNIKNAVEDIKLNTMGVSFFSTGKTPKGIQKLRAALNRKELDTLTAMECHLLQAELKKIVKERGENNTTRNDLISTIYDDIIGGKTKHGLPACAASEQIPEENVVEGDDSTNIDSVPEVEPIINRAV